MSKFSIKYDGYTLDDFSEDVDARIESIERRLRELEERIADLETPAIVDRGARKEIERTIDRVDRLESRVEDIMDKVGDY